MGSAVSTTITSFMTMLAILYYIQRDFGVILKMKSVLKIALAGILMFIATMFFSQGSIVFLLWSTILFAFYLGILYLLKEITSVDLYYLKQIVAKKQKKVQVQEELSGNEPSA
jgi:hypothetical protein